MYCGILCYGTGSGLLGVSLKLISRDGAVSRLFLVCEIANNR